MALSQRERYIAIGVGAALGLLALDRFVLNPYKERRDQLEVDQTVAVQKIDDANRLFQKQRRMQRVWAKMNADGGLKTDPTDAASQVLNAMQDWAQESAINLVSRKEERTTPEGRFLQIGFHFTGTGSMASISKLLWRLETAPIPVRITDVQVTPRKEGTDDLQMQLSVSTLCLLKESDKDKDKPAKPDRSKPVADARDGKGDRP